MGLAQLIVKATRLCNLRCTYCYDWRDGPDQTMPFPVLARMTAAVLRDPQHDVVTFNWHGGETTVLPLSFYEKALLIQARFRRPAQAIYNSLQTNATRLTPEWAGFLRAHAFSVGISLDGPPEIHDRYRRYAGGQPSFADVAAGMQILRDHGISFSVIMVIDEAGLELGPDRLFDFCLQQGITDLGLNFVTPENRPDAAPAGKPAHYVEPARMTGFLVRLYDLWCAHGDPNIHIRELDALRRSLVGCFAGPCTFSGGCFGLVYRIEPNGDVFHCDYFGQDRRYRWGNVLEDDFSALRRSANLEQLQRENHQALAAMAGCPNFAVCHGWCPHERYLSLHHDPDHRADCCGLSDLIDHLRPRERARRAALPVPLVVPTAGTPATGPETLQLA